MLFTIIIFLIILSVLVIVHEAGHFLSAKYFGVQVDEFGLGFPPRAKTLFKTKDGVNWTLNWLPLGGFVKLKGEDGGRRDEPDSFGHKAAWKRVIILVAGVVMNFLLAFVLFAFGFAIGWPQDLTDADVPAQYIKEQNVMIMHVEPETPAEEAGIERGDIIMEVNGNEIVDRIALQQFIKDAGEEQLTLRLERTGEMITKTITPREITFAIPGEETVTTTGLGVSLGTFGIVRYPVHQAIWLGAKNTVSFTGRILSAFGNLIKDVFQGKPVSQNIGGPVMIAALSGRVARLGFIFILQFVALLSLNLAIINILPIPALDGGRILFIFIEKLKGRAVSFKIETIFHMVGFWLLIGLTLLITFRDLARFDIWGRLFS